ncbi:SARP family transcriptional regulator [Sphaerisporangium krabiense]|nr:SARP family transcriptional regulator [Sphaerisporangium krabiense]
MAILLMSPGTPVTVESFLRKLWDGSPPNKARDLVHQSISRLRKPLKGVEEGVRIERSSGGYVLETDRRNIDYHRFRSLHTRARAVTDAGEAVRMYKEAAGLWRGEPLAGLSGAWVTSTRRKLEEELLRAAADRIGLEIAQGVTADLLAELDDLVNRFPLDEKLIELLMLALYSGGRRVDAIGAFRRARDRLATEVGTEPGPTLQTLFQRILQGDRALLPAEPRPTVRKSPNNLPRDTPTFTGRAAELGPMMVAQARDDVVTVIAIDGMPGVGKTALAVHLAHQLAGDHPDGLLFLDLHAHDARRERMDPATALDRLLRDLGVSPIPEGLEERTTAWRTQLAHRRMLIVLDDAAGHDQIRPLLPGVPGCLVLITSRKRLAGLDGVRSLSLDALPPEDAVTLFTRIVEPQRAGRAEDVATVVRLCGYLPLAIALVGNRYRHRPAWTVADLVELLERTDRLLGEIWAEDRRVSAAFELSFRDLDAYQRQAFRRLGLHPGVDLTPPSAAALLGSSRAEAEKILDALLDHHLIMEPRRGRYTFHSLLREYAVGLSDRAPEAETTATIRRALDHFLYTADAADRMLYPFRGRAPLGIPSSLGARPSIRSPAEAHAWLDAELENLLLVARYAADNGWWQHAATLAHVLSRHLYLWAHWAAATRLHTRAVTMWREMGDRPAMARALADLTAVRRRTGHYEEALRSAAEALEIQRAARDDRVVADLLDEHGLVHGFRSELDVAFGYHQQALELRQRDGDRHGEAGTLNYLAKIDFERGDYAKAAERLDTALALYHEVGDPRGEQMTLNNTAHLDERRGDYTAALRHYEEAESVDPMVSPPNRATLLNNVAEIYQRLDRHAEALEQYRRALTAYHDIGDRQSEARVLNNIGTCLAHIGKEREALINYQKALHIAVEISARGDEVQALRNIGVVHHRAKRYEIARSYYEKALEHAQAIGDIYQEARTLDDLGVTLARVGEHAKAEASFRQALDYYEQLNVPEADTLRRRLDPRSDVAES